MRNFRVHEAPRKILFADIDGVLNAHSYCQVAESCLMKPQCVGLLNHIIQETGCRLVISSAWRYMVGEKGMTITGFHYLLRTHGLTAKPADLIVDVTRRDLTRDEPRIRQIADWLDEYRFLLRKTGSERVHFCILDDLSPESMGLAGDKFYERRFVRTEGSTGLTPATARRVIDVFAEQEQQDLEDAVVTQEGDILR